jgi:hypothetical protein
MFICVDIVLPEKVNYAILILEILKLDDVRTQRMMYADEEPVFLFPRD